LVVAAGRAAARDDYELNAYVQAVCPSATSTGSASVGTGVSSRTSRASAIALTTNVGRLRSTGATLDDELPDLIVVMLDQGTGRKSEPYEILLLTASDSPDTLVSDMP
jgi:hypothetical protein